MSMYLSQGPVFDAQREFLNSALPDAPVIPYVERPVRTAAPRRVLAHALHRLADHIAPTPSEEAC
jgi:hypothetical protein